MPQTLTSSSREPKVYSRDGGNYFIYYYDENGKRKKESTGTSDHSRAIAELEKFKMTQRRKAQANASAEEKVEEITFEELCKKFMSYSEANHKLKTRKAYEQTVKFFKEFYSGKISLINKVIVFEYLEETMKRSKSSARKDRVNLSNMFNYAIAKGYLAENPVKGIKPIKLTQKLPLYYSREQINNIVEKCDPDLADIVLFAVNTGLRQGELMNLTWSEIDFMGHQVILTNQNFLTKTDKVRSIPLNNTAMSVLAHRDRNSEFVFTYLKRQWNQYTLWDHFKVVVRELGLNDKYNFHTLRHTFASWLVQKGVSLSYIQELLGHAKIETTQIYAHLTPKNLVTSVNLLD